MPAIAPPDRWLPLRPAAAAVDDDLADEVGDAVAVAVEVTSAIDEVIVGKTTPAHRVSAFEL